jgi:hypothetical protein
VSKSNLCSEYHPNATGNFYAVNKFKTLLIYYDIIELSTMIPIHATTRYGDHEDGGHVVTSALGPNQNWLDEEMNGRIGDLADCSTSSVLGGYERVRKNLLQRLFIVVAAPVPQNSVCLNMQFPPRRSEKAASSRNENEMVGW